MQYCQTCSQPGNEAELGTPRSMSSLSARGTRVSVSVISVVRACEYHDSYKDLIKPICSAGVILSEQAEATIRHRSSITRRTCSGQVSSFCGLLVGTAYCSKSAIYWCAK